MTGDVCFGELLRYDMIYKLDIFISNYIYASYRVMKSNEQTLILFYLLLFASQQTLAQVDHDDIMLSSMPHIILSVNQSSQLSHCTHNSDKNLLLLCVLPCYLS